MSFANVIFDADKYVIDPVFNDLVQKFALERPNFVFTTKNTREHFSHNRSVDKKVEAPDGKLFIQRLDVYVKSTNEFLGRIGVNVTYRRRAPENYEFFVESWRITNQRGDRNRATSSKLASILRTAKRSLIPKGYDEVLTNAAEELSSSLQRSLSDLMGAIANQRLLPSGSGVTMQMYIYRSMAGETHDTLSQNPQLAALIDAFKSGKYRKGVEEYNLAMIMRKYDEKSLLRAVVSYNGGYLYTLKGVDGIMHHSYNELPEWMQNHIGVLQLMEDRELVRDVGYRLNNTHFAVLQPE